jgi:hypothetical protein
MSRVIAIMACGFTLTACTSSWMPSFDMSSFTPSFGGSAQQPVSLAVESDPPGADARSSTGPASCRTPCQLTVTPSGPFTVSIALNGYLPQTVPVQVGRPDDPRITSEEGGQSVRLDPNPIFVELTRAPAPPPAAKRKPHRAPTATRRAPATTGARRTPTTAAAPSAPPQFEPAPTTAAAPPPPPPAAAPSSTAAAPWPMPR